MLKLPQSFAASASRNMPRGSAWIETLPEAFAACVDRWELTHWAMCDGLGSNLVGTARSRAYGDVVLKVEGPHETRHTEPAALLAYDGRHACRLLDVHEDVGALLLERVIPGTMLKSVGDPETQLAIGTDLVVNLPVPPPDTTTFPSYADWIERAFGIARDSASPDPSMLAFMEEAEDDFANVLLVDPSQVLLHGDLHHENIVRGPGGTWKAIDPQGVIGPACLESGRFIQNHAGDDERSALNVYLMSQAVEQLAARLNQTPLTIARCTFVLDVLSTAWGYEMNYPAERIAARLRYTKAIQSMKSSL